MKYFIPLVTAFGQTENWVLRFPGSASQCPGVGNCLDCVPIDYDGMSEMTYCDIENPCAALVEYDDCQHTGFRTVHSCQEGACGTPLAYMFVQDNLGNNPTDTMTYHYFNRAGVDELLEEGLSSKPAFLAQYEAEYVPLQTTLIECPSALLDLGDDVEKVVSGDGTTALCGQEVMIYHLLAGLPRDASSSLMTKRGVVTHYSEGGAPLGLIGYGATLGTSTSLVIWEFVPPVTCVDLQEDWDMCPGFEKFSYECTNGVDCQCGGPFPEPPCPAAFKPGDQEWPGCGECSSMGGENVMFVGTLPQDATDSIQVHGLGEDRCPATPVIQGLASCQSFVQNRAVACGVPKGNIYSDDLCIDTTESLFISHDCGSSAYTPCFAIIGTNGVADGHGPAEPMCGECGTVGTGEDKVYVRYVATDPDMYGIHILTSEDNCPMSPSPLEMDDECFRLVICSSVGQNTTDCPNVPFIREDAACTEEDPCAGVIGSEVGWEQPWPECGDCGIVASGDRDIHVMYVRKTTDPGIFVPDGGPCPAAGLTASTCYSPPTTTTTTTTTTTHKPLPDEVVVGDNGGASASALMTAALVAIIAFV